MLLDKKHLGIGMERQAKDTYWCAVKSQLEVLIEIFPYDCIAGSSCFSFSIQ